MNLLTNYGGTGVLPAPSESGVREGGVFVPNLENDVTHAHNQRIVDRAAELVFADQKVSPSVVNGMMYVLKLTTRTLKIRKTP